MPSVSAYYWKKSVRQLAYAKASVTDIAFACGYENQVPFNKAFKKQFHCTPTHVRHNCRCLFCLR